MAEAKIFESDAVRRTFFYQLEQAMRRGQADEAEQSLRQKLQLLPSCYNELKSLAAKTHATSVMLHGWKNLGDCMYRARDAGEPITAIQLNISWPGHYLDPQEIIDNYYLDPIIEAMVYQAREFDYPDARRADFNAMCERYHPWQGGGGNVDFPLEGLGALYGEVQRLHYFQSDLPNAKDANWIAEGLVAVILHQAARMAIREYGLPFAIPVFVGSNESTPFFHALVADVDEYCAIAGQWPFGEPAPRKPIDRRPAWEINEEGRRRFEAKQAERIQRKKEEYERREEKRRIEKENYVPPSIDEMFSRAFGAAGMPDLHKLPGNPNLKMGITILGAIFEAMGPGGRKR